MSAVTASSPRRIWRDCILLLLLAAIPALLSGWFHPKRPVLLWTKPGVAEVELSEVMRWSTRLIWVDARGEKDFQERHVPGAVLLNESDWEILLPGFIGVWQPSSKVIVYCDSQACDASQAVALRLQRELKLSEIYVLQGGWATWAKTHP